MIWSRTSSSGGGRRRLYLEHGLFCQDQESQAAISNTAGLLFDRVAICSAAVEPSVRPAQTRELVSGRVAEDDVEGETSVSSSSFGNQWRGMLGDRTNHLLPSGP
jgi:hypothetical protein